VEYLLKALEEAKKRKGYTSPNPSVGALLVKNNRIISTGYHLGPGSPHAEVDCIEKAKCDIEDSSLYVTLEPCCFYGRTPPCTEYLIRKKIQNVYYGFIDPNPKVSGKGAKILKEAGIHCEKINVPEIDDFYKSYSYWVNNLKPIVTAKLAISLNGKVAGPNGERIKLTSNIADEFTHINRNSSDAILTTINTLINDNPKLNVRLNGESFKKPLYVIDRNLKFTNSLQVYDFAEKITLFHGFIKEKKNFSILNEEKIKSYEIEEKNGLLVLKKVIEFIGKEGIHDLWVEVGPRMICGLIEEKLINKMYFYIAPKIIDKNYMDAFLCDFIKSASSFKWSSLGPDGLLEIEYVFRNN